MIKKDLLFIKSEKGNIKIKDVARLLRKSSQRMKYSISAMEKESIIHNPGYIFDYSYFGLILFRVYFKGAYISEADKVKMIRQLSDNGFVVAIYEVSGEFELIVEIQAKNPSKFNKVLRMISDENPNLRHYKILLNIVTHIYPRYYLTENKTLHSLVPDQIIIGGDRDVEDFSVNELSVIKALLRNPVSRLTSLAKQASLNIKTVKSTIGNLEKRHIIKGIKYQINTSHIDIDRFRMYLNLHNLSIDREKDLLKYLGEVKEIIQANKTVGDWDLEVDIESPNKTRARMLVNEFREKFKDIIENFNIMEFYQCHKRNYLPDRYFEKE